VVVVVVSVVVVSSGMVVVVVVGQLASRVQGLTRKIWRRGE
jgi:hypothetical protein